MGWERLNRDRLAKVLALAASNRDGEALSALRKASGMLNTVGLDFGDLARRLDGAEPGVAPAAGDGPSRPGPTPPPNAAERQPPRNGEMQLLLRQISSLHGRVARAEADSAFQRAEAQHWHDLTIEAARYICLLEDELFAARRALDDAGPAGAAEAASDATAADRSDRDRSAAATGGALGERIAQFVAWQKTAAKARPH